MRPVGAAADDAAALAAVRPLFFSPLYLPAAATATSELASPGDAPSGAGSPVGAGAGGGAAGGAGGGLVLTALFSAPAPAHLQTLCSLPPQELLRESLSAHYDVPPTLLRRSTLCAADRRASLPAATPTSCAGPLGPGALSWAPDPPPTASLYLAPPPPTPAPAPAPATDHVYEELPCWPRMR